MLKMKRVGVFELLDVENKNAKLESVLGSLIFNDMVKFWVVGSM